jgi:hypothetical protein
MRPITHYELMQARVADLHREAELDRLAEAATRPRRARRAHSRKAGLSQPATLLVRRALAALGSRSL